MHRTNLKVQDYNIRNGPSVMIHIANSHFIHKNIQTYKVNANQDTNYWCIFCFQCSLMTSGNVISIKNFNNPDFFV